MQNDIFKIKNKNFYLTDKHEFSKEYDGVYIFFSFDLVNSTLFKTIYPKKWTEFVFEFYNLAKDIKNKDENIQVWKYVGDEILFYKKVLNFEDLYKAPIDTKGIILDIEKKLKEKLNKEDNIQKVDLYIKATIWIAEAEKIDTSKESNKNSRIKNKIIDTFVGGVENFDFLGSDIDNGFRISKFTERSKIVIGAKLAYLLFKYKKEIQDKHHISVEENLKIVSYETLKGVWNGRKYPIIWYDENWSNKDEMFFYDEVFNSKIVDIIDSEGFHKLEKYKIKRIKKIFQDLEKIEEMDEIEETIKISKDNSPKLPDKVCSEIHCVAICFNNEKKILIAKRKSDKDFCPNCWDFGCAKMKRGDSFKKAMIRDYKRDFNIEIEFINDELIPVSTYEVNYKNRKTTSGIIFIAKVKDYKNIKVNKHQEFKWITKKDLKNEKFKDELKVGKFEESIKSAINIIENDMEL